MFKEDIELAKKARLNAHAPYSNYFVGACLRCKDGTTFLGCNVENQGIQGLCAERTAFVKAISEGRKDFASIAIVGAPKDEEPITKCMPCGYCRQFISEFVDENFEFVFEDNGNIITYKLDDLLPNRFEL
jgi:cytidine deaminase